MKYLEFDNKEKFEEYLVTNKREMYEMIWRAIDKAAAMEDNIAQIVEIFLVSEDKYIDMESERDNWIDSLELALNFFISVEEYETCSEIKALIEKIKTLQNRAL